MSKPQHWIPLLLFGILVTPGCSDQGNPISSTFQGTYEGTLRYLDGSSFQVIVLTFDEGAYELQVLTNPQANSQSSFLLDRGSFKLNESIISFNMPVCDVAMNPVSPLLCGEFSYRHDGHNLTLEKRRQSGLVYRIAVHRIE